MLDIPNYAEIIAEHAPEDIAKGVKESPQIWGDLKRIQVDIENLNRLLSVNWDTERAATIERTIILLHLIEGAILQEGITLEGETSAKELLHISAKIYALIRSKRA